MCIFSCCAAKLQPQRAELSNIHPKPLFLACLQKVLFAQAAPCPKTAEIKSDFSREPRHVCRGFVVGYVSISLNPRKITSFLQNLISGYFSCFGKGEKRAYCASENVICKGCGVLQSHGSCESLRLVFSWALLVSGAKLGWRCCLSSSGATS